MTDTLRDRIAAAIRDAACPGDCDNTEEECREQRLQPFVWHHGVIAEVEGTPEQFADAVLPLLVAELTAAADELAADADSLDAQPGPLENNYARGMRQAAVRLRNRADAAHPATEEQP